MKKLIPILAAALMIVSCDAIEGSLKVNEELTVRAKKSGLFQMGTTEIKVAAGSYQAKLNPTSKTNINLEMVVNGKEQKIPFQVASGTQIPEVEGKIDVLSAENGQPYDLQAIIRTDLSSSDFDQTETCVSGYISQRRCETTPSSRFCSSAPARQVCEEHRDRRGNVSRICRSYPSRQECVYTPATTNCRVDQVPVYGRQLVTYEKITSVKHIDIDLISAGSSVAQFKHVKTTNKNIRRGSSYCR